MTFLAIRHLLARRGQTLFTLLGIFLGSTAYVTISGFMLGFREYFVTQLVNNNAHISIQPREDFLTTHGLDQALFQNPNLYINWNVAPSGRKDSAIVENPQQWYKLLKNHPEVSAFTPQLTAAVLMTNGKASIPTTITGCDPIQQKRVTTIGDNIIEGKFEDLASGGNRLVIGDELRKKLGVKFLQNIMISSSQSATSIPFKIVGIFKTGNKQIDSLAYGSLTDIQTINRTPNQVNKIAVKLKDYLKAAKIALTWSSFSSENIESWDQINANIYEMFKLQDAIRYLAVGSILIVAGFGIYNVLNMTVMQKRKDIAILRSLGYEESHIISLFFSQGMILGFIGAFFGLICGYCISLYLQTIPFGGGPLNSQIGTLKVSFNPMIYIQSGLLALISASVASLIPARNAGKLTPIEIIRAGTE